LGRLDALPRTRVAADVRDGVAQGGMLMVVDHVAMLACMLVAMLLRRDEYSGAAHIPAAPGRDVAEPFGLAPAVARSTGARGRWF
jgi:hypothetical protein